MSRSSVNAARAERRAARVLGGRRNVRPDRFTPGPDVLDVPGWTPEIKWRTKLPAIVTSALKQATAYAILGQRPCGVIFRKGSSGAVVVLRLEDFAELVRRPQAPRDATPSPEASLPGDRPAGASVATGGLT